MQIAEVKNFIGTKVANKAQFGLSYISRCAKSYGKKKDFILASVYGINSVETLSCEMGVVFVRYATAQTGWKGDADYQQKRESAYTDVQGFENVLFQGKKNPSQFYLNGQRDPDKHKAIFVTIINGDHIATKEEKELLFSMLPPSAQKPSEQPKRETRRPKVENVVALFTTHKDAENAFNEMVEKLK